ncbi:MAG: hypothetical protein PHZ03_02265 [Syntrophomonas sp.]|nr:hypothetical protein [Syntrophomonas sp.]
MIKLTHHQQWGCKNNHKHKSSRSMIPVSHFTIIMNNCNSNANNDNNNNTNNNNNHYCKECNSKKAPAFEPICCDNPHEHPHCIPRRGELMINGGFENRQNPFLGWVINSGVEEIDPSIGDIPHQGLNAARLGSPKPYALLYQDVPGICPGSFFQLNFFMSAATKCGNAFVNVRMEFLDHCKNLLDSPALEILIPKNSLSNEVFTGFNNATHVAAPPDTWVARISFELNTNEYPDRYVHLDDVSLIAI